MPTTTELDESAPIRERARPMAPDERRAALVQRVIPLLQERGRDVSTREIAETCGVAEGTLFRAFGDKESLIAAAIDACLDPQPFQEVLAGVDPALPPEEKMRLVLALLRDRFTGSIGLMTAIGMRGGPPPAVRHADGWMPVLEALLEPDRAVLAAPPSTVARYLRMLALAAAVPQHDGRRPFESDDLLQLVLHGVLAPAPAEEG